MATVRSRRVSLDRYTSPIPPAPNGATISYGPSRVPAESAMDLYYYDAGLNRDLTGKDLAFKIDGMPKKHQGGFTSR